jgi:hypothetical protein
MCLFALSAAAVHALSPALPVTLTTPVTFATVNVGSTVAGCTGCTDTETVSLTLNQAMTISSVSIPPSANGHVEWAIGTITGCTVNGTTSNPAATVCSIPVTFQPFYPGPHAVPLALTTSTGQVYSVPLIATANGGLQHIEPDSTSTVVGQSATTATSVVTDNISATASNAFAPVGVSIDNSEDYFLAQGVNITQNPRIRVVYNQVNPALACLIIIEQPAFFGSPTSGCAGATSQPTVGDIYTLAGIGTSSAGLDNILATTSALSALTDVAADANYDVFLVEQGNSRVRVIYNGGAQVACLIQIENPTLFGVTGNNCTTATSLPTLGFIYTIAGTGTAGTSDTGALASAVAVSLPSAMVVSTSGDVYFTTSAAASSSAATTGRVKLLYNGGAAAAALIAATNSTVPTPTKGFLYTIAGNATATAETQDSNTLATGTSVGILTSNGIAVDASGDVYFSDATFGSGTPLGTAKVRVIYNGGTALKSMLALQYVSVTPTVGYVYEVAGTTVGASKTYAGGEGLLGNASQLISPWGISLDAAGDLLIAERYAYIQRRLLIGTGKINAILGVNGTATQSVTVGTEYTTLTGTSLSAPAAADDGTWGIKNGNSGAFYPSQPIGNRLHRASVQTGTISFATTAVTVTGTAYPLLYTNVGNAPVTIGAITMPADFVLQASTVTNGSIAGISACVVGTAIPAGSSCSIAVAPSPTTSGTLSETMTVTDNALGGEITSHTITLAVAATGTAITLSTNPAAITGGNPTVINAILTTTVLVVGVQTPAPVTSGNVVFSSGVTSIGTSPISDTVVASTAVTAGGSGYTSAPAVTFTCTPPSCTGGSGATGTATIVGDAVSSITVTNYGTGYTSAPAITLTGGGGTGAAATSTIGGLATITSSIFAAPSTSITATYAAQASFTAGAATKVFTVSAKPATTTVTGAVPVTPNLNQTVTLSASVTSAIAGTPTGTVNFYDGAPPPGSGTLLGSGTLSSSAVASMTISTLAVGAHTIQASYLGDSVYATSVDATGVVVTVVAPAYTVTWVSANGTPVAAATSGNSQFAGIAVPQGLNGILSFNVTSIGGFSGTVTPVCNLTGLPANLGCLFTPASVTFTGTNTTMGETIYVTTQQLHAANRTANPILAAFLLPGAGLALFGLRRRKALKGWQQLAMLCVLFAGSLLAVGALSGCGNGLNIQSAPKGSYLLPITFTSGSTIYPASPLPAFDLTVTVTGN